MLSMLSLTASTSTAVLQQQVSPAGWNRCNLTDRIDLQLNNDSWPICRSEGFWIWHGREQQSITHPLGIQPSPQEQCSRLQVLRVPGMHLQTP